MIKNAQWIIEQGEKLIKPFIPEKRRWIKNDFETLKAISYGISGFGVDLRLSPNQFKVFRHIPGQMIDPKNFNPEFLYDGKLCGGENGDYFILPHHSYALGVSLEYIDIPDNIEVLFIGKSTYARCGIIVNMTPGEACMSDDTDVLMLDGWKKLKDVNIGDLAMTLNKNSGVAEYQPILAKQEYNFNGNLIHFNSKYIDQLVTPQHRMWAARRTRRNGNNHFKWDLISASDIIGKWNYHIPRNVLWFGQNQIGNSITIGKYTIDIDTWCEFIGAWMGDGSAFDNGDGNYVVKLAVVSKENKRKYFRNLLSRMGVNSHESKSGFSFQDKAVVEYLLPYKYAKNKHLPVKIKALTPNLLRRVIVGMMNSDGNKQTNTYFSSSKRLIDDFQEICIKAGYNATVWEKEGYSKLTKTHSKMYACRYSSQNKLPNKINPKTNIERVAYNGMVYDVTVPNHIFMSRRNGKASWTGNSWRGHLTIEISNSSDADAMIYANEGICQALFFEGETTSLVYGDSKYQNQSEQVTLARV